MKKFFALLLAASAGFSFASAQTAVPSRYNKRYPRKLGRETEQLPGSGSVPVFIYHYQQRANCSDK